jgi:hypothetical protein
MPKRFAQVLESILDDYFFEFFSESIIEEIKVKYEKYHQKTFVFH